MEHDEGVNTDDETKATEHFEEQAESTIDAIRLLIDINQVHISIRNLTRGLDLLNKAKMELPERDHSPTVTMHSLAYTQLRSLLDNSAIDRRHSFHADIDQLQERLQSLSTKVDTRRDATSSDVEHSHSSRAYRRDAVKRPPINLPNFYGDVMHWKSFWATFSSAIGDDPNLSNINKLSYLQGCIKDPNLNSITFTGVDFDAE